MNSSIRKAFLALLTASLLATASFAAPTLGVDSFGQGASFTTDFVFENAWLSISGPDGYTQHVKFSAIEELAFTLGDEAVDGLYNWEILLVEAAGKAPLGAVGAERNAARVPRGSAPAAKTFSGIFQVRAGLVELPTAGPGFGDSDIATKAEVVNDDQIIKGSQCVGSDCTNSESFGSDTIRLKENNLRIHFNDTSTSSNFPNNDWRININSTNNNGLNFFGIQDATANNTPFRVEAGAGGNRLYIEDDGQIGMGTSNPIVALHITDGNSPAVRLEQDGSDGFTAQSWDLAGNETNFFIRDVTNSSKLPFRIKPDTDGNTLFLNSTGVGIGVNDNGARAPFHVRGGGSNHDPSNDAVLALFQNDSADTDGAIVSILAGNGTANAQMWFGDADDDNAGRIIYRNGSDAMSFWTSGAERFFIESDGGVCIGCNNDLGDAIRHSNGAHLTSGGTWTNASSRTLKQDITELEAGDAMAVLNQLAPVTFRYKSELDETYVGFIAEDVPELVAMKDRQSLTSMDIVAVLTKVVQEQQKSFEAERAGFEAALTALQTRLEALESVD